MPDLIQLLVILLCAAAITLIIYLIMLAMRLIRLTDDVQKRLDNDIAPLIAQTTNTVNRVNHMVSKIGAPLDWIGLVTHTAGESSVKPRPSSPANRFVT